MNTAYIGEYKVFLIYSMYLLQKEFWVHELFLGQILGSNAQLSTHKYCNRSDNSQKQDKLKTYYKIERKLQPKKNLTPLYISAAGSSFADNAESRVLCHQMLVCKLVITIV